MANSCDTTYKIKSSKERINSLWEGMNELEVNSSYTPLISVAEKFKVNHKGMSLRGSITCVNEPEYIGEDAVLTVVTETAWTGCHELFNAINETMNQELSISYCEIEPGCEVYNIHDEENFFPDIHIVDCCGDTFDGCYEETYESAEDAVADWCKCMEIDPASLNSKTTEEKVSYINNYEYDDDDTYFKIHRFYRE